MQWKGPVPEHPCSADGCHRSFCGHGPVEHEVRQAYLVVPVGRRLVHYDRWVALEGPALIGAWPTREQAVAAVEEFWRDVRTEEERA